MLGGAGPTNGEQPLFGLWNRDPRQRPDLRIRQLTTGERLRQPRQRAERARDADVLTRGARLESHAPGQPRRARTEAIAPAAAGVEFADQLEQPRGGRVEMRGELGDLVAEALELDAPGMGRDEVRAIDVHRRISLRRLYTRIFDRFRCLQEPRSSVAFEFFSRRIASRASVRANAAGTLLRID
jgi:hypothetical protein